MTKHVPQVFAEQSTLDFLDYCALKLDDQQASLFWLLGIFAISLGFSFLNIRRVKTAVTSFCSDKWL
jgi:hypothetical protein